jgi:hypothetical protein
MELDAMQKHSLLHSLSGVSLVLIKGEGFHVPELLGCYMRGLDSIYTGTLGKI